MDEFVCPGCQEVLTELDLAGITAPITYDAQGRPWHTSPCWNERVGYDD